MNLTDVLLAPVRGPARVVRALDDLATLADHARRSPDPVEEVRRRLDLLVIEMGELVAVARELIDGGAELTATARSVVRTGQAVDTTGRTIVTGGQDLTATAQQVDADTRELIAGGARLTEVAEEVEVHLRALQAALPRVLAGFDTVDQLEDAVETVAETVEPLQGAAERVGRMTDRFSRSRR